jgi:hypothetical protein
MEKRTLVLFIMEVGGGSCFIWFGALLITSLLMAQVVYTTIERQFPESKSFVTTGQPKLNNMKATVFLNESIQERIKCEFRFSTIDCEDVREKLKRQAEELENVKLTNKYHLLKQLNNECFIKADKYWKYEFCVGKEVLQMHGAHEKLVLGKFAHQQGDTQLYNEGSLCETRKPRIEVINRQITVKFMCGKSAAIVSLSEPRTCVYRATIAHPALCAEDSPFEKYTGHEGESTTHSYQTPVDSWVLHLEKTSSGEYMCSLRSLLRYLKQKPDTCFSNFSLSVYTVIKMKDNAETLEERPHKLLSVLGKEQQGKQLKKSQMDTIAGGVKSNDSRFTGFLEYIYIKTRK